MGFGSIVPVEDRLDPGGMSDLELKCTEIVKMARSDVSVLKG